MINYLETIDEIVKGVKFTITADALREWLKVHLKHAYQFGFADGSEDQLRKREQDLEQSIYGREAMIKNWNPEDSVLFIERENMLLNNPSLQQNH